MNDQELDPYESVVDAVRGIRGHLWTAKEIADACWSATDSDYQYYGSRQVPLTERAERLAGHLKVLKQILAG
jgi:hypothetical protein